MCSVVDRLRRIVGTDCTVLLEGESGTGKGLVARAIHQLSPRRERPFVAPNCAAIPEALLESELFGHAKGAYTGASAEQRGLLQAADRGTLFLDEVESLFLPHQGKLLQFLDDGSFRRLGEATPHRADVRVIAASNRDLQALVAAQRFREDLFHRLNVFRVELPPLRERDGDVRTLAAHFLGQLARSSDGKRKRFSREALAALETYPWPGNVRELRNEVERALLLTRGPTIAVDDLSPEIGAAHRVAQLGGSSFKERRRVLVETWERAEILSGLRRTGGQVAVLARQFGLARQNLWRKVRKYGIEPRDLAQQDDRGPSPKP